MITLAPGSHACHTLSLLSAAGEFPMLSRYILGSDQVLKKLYQKLRTPQDFCFPGTDTLYSGKMILICGKGRSRSVRLYRPAVELLHQLHPLAYDSYMESFHHHFFPTDLPHVERNHRIAEAVAMCLSAGIEYRPYCLPPLHTQGHHQQAPAQTAFYTALSVKKAGDGELNKTKYSRTVGMLVTPSESYAVYNTRNAVMKWQGDSEFKIRTDLLELSRINWSFTDFHSAVLFGASYDIALKTLLDMEKHHRLEFRFDGVYHHIHFIPLNSFGIRMLRLYSVPNWKQRLLDALFDPEELVNGFSATECDAFINGVCVVSHLDGDIARLARLRLPALQRPKQFEILCYPEQLSFLREYLSPEIPMKVITIDAVEEALMEGCEPHD